MPCLRGSVVAGNDVNTHMASWGGPRRVNFSKGSAKEAIVGPQGMPQGQQAVILNQATIKFVTRELVTCGNAAILD